MADDTRAAEGSPEMQILTLTDRDRELLNLLRDLAGDFAENDAAGLPAPIANPDDAGSPTSSLARSGEADQWLHGSWGGYPQISCKICGWDTLEGLATAEDHKRSCPRCGLKVSGQPSANAPMIPIADKHGREIK